MLLVLPKNKYRVTKRANVDTARREPALAAVTRGVLTTVGIGHDTATYLSTVSY